MGIPSDEWLDGSLGAEELAALRVVSVRVSKSRELDLYSLIAGWYQHVSKIQADLILPDSNRTAWGAHDLLAALSLRDMVAQGVGQLDPILSKTVKEVIAIADREFLSFTEKDDSRFAEMIDASIVISAGWWWERIPVSGPIRREIDTIRGRAVN